MMDRNEMASSPPAGIPAEHVRMTKGPRRNSCEAMPGLIESTHLAPLNEGLMSPGHRSADLDESPMKEDQPRRYRRNSCEARPGLIESTHLAPLNEGLMAPDQQPMHLKRS